MRYMIPSPGCSSSTLHKEKRAHKKCEGTATHDGPTQGQRRTEPMCFFIKIMLLGVAMKYLSPVYEMEGVEEFKRLECRPAYSTLKMHASGTCLAR